MSAEDEDDARALAEQLARPLSQLLAASSPERVAALCLALRPALAPPLTPERRTYLEGVVTDLLAG